MVVWKNELIWQKKSFFVLQWLLQVFIVRHKTARRNRLLVGWFYVGSYIVLVFGMTWIITVLVVKFFRTWMNVHSEVILFRFFVLLINLCCLKSSIIKKVVHASRKKGGVKDGDYSRIRRKEQTTDHQRPENRKEKKMKRKKSKSFRLKYTYYVVLLSIALSLISSIIISSEQMYKKETFRKTLKFPLQISAAHSSFIIEVARLLQWSCNHPGITRKNSEMQTS